MLSTPEETTSHLSAGVGMLGSAGLSTSALMKTPLLRAFDHDSTRKLRTRPLNVEASMQNADAPNNKTLHIDIGGEGRYPDAINVNPGMFGNKPVTSGPQPGGAGAAGRPIPNLVQAPGERLPFGNQSVDVVTLQHSPIRPATVIEIARVIRPGGDIRLVGPNTPEVLAAHQNVANAVGGNVYRTVVGNDVFTNIIVPRK